MSVLPLPPSEALQALRWRYAVKAFDASAVIPAETWSALEEALVLTPSSYGLQPWKFVVVTDPVLKAKLQTHSWNQKQVTQCSHFVVFLYKLGITAEDVDRWIERLASVQGVAPENLKMYRGFMIADIVEGPRQRIANEWATRQVYIALGNFMTTAAMLGVDTCPMEGIDPAGYDDALGLKDSGYATVVACAAGRRSDADKYAAVPKARWPSSDVIVRR